MSIYNDKTASSSLAKSQDADKAAYTSSTSTNKSTADTSSLKTSYANSLSSNNAKAETIASQKAASDEAKNTALQKKLLSYSLSNLATSQDVDKKQNLLSGKTEVTGKVGGKSLSGGNSGDDDGDSGDGGTTSGTTISGTGYKKSSSSSSKDKDKEEESDSTETDYDSLIKQALEQQRQSELASALSTSEYSNDKLAKAYQQLQRENYISAQLKNQAMKEQLASTGANGGALASYYARANNDYANARQSAYGNYLSGITDANNVYANAVNTANSNYNSNYYNYLLNLAQIQANLNADKELYEYQNSLS